MNKLYKFTLVAIFACFAVLVGMSAFAADDYWNSTLGPQTSGDTTAYTYVINGGSTTITGEGIPVMDKSTASVLIWEVTGWYYTYRDWDAADARTGAHDSTNIGWTQGALQGGNPWAQSATKTFWLEGKAGIRSATSGISDKIAWVTIPFQYPLTSSVMGATNAGISTYGIYTADVKGLSWIRLRCAGATISGGSQVVQLAVQ